MTIHDIILLILLFLLISSSLCLAIPWYIEMLAQKEFLRRRRIEHIFEDYHRQHTRGERRSAR